MWIGSAAGLVCWPLASPGLPRGSSGRGAAIRQRLRFIDAQSGCVDPPGTVAASFFVSAVRWYCWLSSLSALRRGKKPDFR